MFSDSEFLRLSGTVIDGVSALHAEQQQQEFQSLIIQVSLQPASQQVDQTGLLFFDRDLGNLRFDGQCIVIGSVTDGYNPFEEHFQRTRHLLEELRGTTAEILICTKSDLVLRDLDLLREFPRVTVSWSVNTLDEAFRADMDRAVSIGRRFEAMRQVYEAGIRTVCFVSPIFPGITDPKAIIERVRDFTDLVWLENLNLRGSFKAAILAYIREKRPELVTLYEEIYNRRRTDYWQALEREMAAYAAANGLPYRVNDLPYGRSEKGHPVVVNYFYHEKIRLGNQHSDRKNA